ncbi:MAG TPA: cysteine peptidase family C39 domain-containing protein, partial [Candidatus Margulisiibacteriota bacterium]|nr:cysteine peptidase family C39 domain-containing protein [Candidatus Margulisiibacteriota bacterium]
MDEIRKIEPESQPASATAKPEFKSSFKSWIRVVAFIVVAVFLPEQAAQAVEYDWRVLWQKPAAGAFAPGYLKDMGRLDIPLAVRNILQDMAGKQITSVRLSPELTLELDKPLNISKGRIEEIYNWLKDKPCGAKALFDYLTYKSVSVTEQDIAVLTLTIDILNGVTEPKGNPEVVKSSLYALSQASAFFGNRLYPVSLKELSVNLTAPFIAHLKDEHYILVTRVTEEKVYFIDKQKEEFFPKDKFLSLYSGYALVPESGIGVSLSASEAKKVLGAKKDWTSFDQPTDLSYLFQKPKIGDQLLSLGITIGSSLIMPGQSGFLTSFTTSMFVNQMSQTGTLVAISAGMKPEYAQFVGYGVSGALSGLMSVGQNHDLYKSGWDSTTKSYKSSLWNNNNWIRGLTIGTMQSTLVCAANYGLYEVFKDTKFYKNNPVVASQILSFAGSRMGYLASNALLSAMDLNVSTDYDASRKIKNKKIQEQLAKLTGDQATIDEAMKSVTYGFKDTNGNIVNGKSYIRLNSAPLGMSAFGLAIRDPAFLSSTLSQGISLGIDYLAGKDEKKNKGLRILGEAVGVAMPSLGQGFGSFALQGVMSGLSSWALNSIGGEYDEKTGRYKKSGMTRLQMESLKWLGTAALYSALGSAFSNDRGTFGSFLKGKAVGLATNIWSFGETAPDFTRGSGGWTGFAYTQKLAMFGGIDRLTQSADSQLASINNQRLDQGLKPLTWKQFVKEGYATSLMPSLGASYVEYLTQTIQYDATDNLAQVGRLVLEKPYNLWKFGSRVKGIDGNSVMVVSLAFPELAGTKGFTSKHGVTTYFDSTGASVGTVALNGSGLLEFTPTVGKARTLEFGKYSDLFMSEEEAKTKYGEGTYLKLKENLGADLLKVQRHGKDKGNYFILQEERKGLLSNINVAVGQKAEGKYTFGDTTVEGKFWSVNTQDKGLVGFLSAGGLTFKDQEKDLGYAFAGIGANGPQILLLNSKESYRFLPASGSPSKSAVLSAQGIANIIQIIGSGLTVKPGSLASFNIDPTSNRLTPTIDISSLGGLAEGRNLFINEATTKRAGLYTTQGRYELKGDKLDSVTQRIISSDAAKTGYELKITDKETTKLSVFGKTLRTADFKKQDLTSLDINSLGLSSAVSSDLSASMRQMVEEIGGYTDNAQLFLYGKRGGAESQEFSPYYAWSGNNLMHENLLLTGGIGLPTKFDYYEYVNHISWTGTEKAPEGKDLFYTKMYDEKGNPVLEGDLQVKYLGDNPQIFDKTGLSLTTQGTTKIHFDKASFDNFDLYPLIFKGSLFDVANFFLAVSPGSPLPFMLADVEANNGLIKNPLKPKEGGSASQPSPIDVVKNGLNLQEKDANYEQIMNILKRGTYGELSRASQNEYENVQLNGRRVFSFSEQTGWNDYTYNAKFSIPHSIALVKTPVLDKSGQNLFLNLGNAKVTIREGKSEFAMPEGQTTFSGAKDYVNDKGGEELQLYDKGVLRSVLQFFFTNKSGQKIDSLTLAPISMDNGVAKSLMFARVIQNNIDHPENYAKGDLQQIGEEVAPDMQKELAENFIAHTTGTVDEKGYITSGTSNFIELGQFSGTRNKQIDTAPAYSTKKSFDWGGSKVSGEGFFTAEDAAKSGNNYFLNGVGSAPARVHEVDLTNMGMISRLANVGEFGNVQETGKLSEKGLKWDKSINDNDPLLLAAIKIANPGKLVNYNDPLLLAAITINNLGKLVPVSMGEVNGQRTILFSEGKNGGELFNLYQGKFGGSDKLTYGIYKENLDNTPVVQAGLAGTSLTLNADSYLRYSGNGASFKDKNFGLSTEPVSGKAWGEIRDSNGLLTDKLIVEEHGRISGIIPEGRVTFDPNKGLYLEPTLTNLDPVQAMAARLDIDTKQYKDKELTKQIQLALNENGANLKVDGIVGSKTTAAIKQYESEHPTLTDKIPGYTKEGASGLVYDFGNNKVSGSFGVFVDLLDQNNQPNFAGLQQIVDRSNIKIVNGFDANKDKPASAEEIRAGTMKLYENRPDILVGNGEIFSKDASGGGISANKLTVVHSFENINGKFAVEFANDKLSNLSFVARGLNAMAFGISGMKGWKEWNDVEVLDVVKGGFIEKGIAQLVNSGGVEQSRLGKNDMLSFETRTSALVFPFKVKDLTLVSNEMFKVFGEGTSKEPQQSNAPKSVAPDYLLDKAQLTPGKGKVEVLTEDTGAETIHTKELLMKEGSLGVSLQRDNLGKLHAAIFSPYVQGFEFKSETNYRFIDGKDPVKAFIFSGSAVESNKEDMYITHADYGWNRKGDAKEYSWGWSSIEGVMIKELSRTTEPDNPVEAVIRTDKKSTERKDYNIATYAIPADKPGSKSFAVIPYALDVDKGKLIFPGDKFLFGTEEQPTSSRWKVYNQNNPEYEFQADNGKVKSLQQQNLLAKLTPFAIDIALDENKKNPEPQMVSFLRNDKSKNVPADLTSGALIGNRPVEIGQINIYKEEKIKGKAISGSLVGLDMDEMKFFWNYQNGQIKDVNWSATLLKKEIVFSLGYGEELLIPLRVGKKDKDNPDNLGALYANSLYYEGKTKSVSSGYLTQPFTYNGEITLTYGLSGWNVKDDKLFSKKLNLVSTGKEKESLTLEYNKDGFKAAFDNKGQKLLTAESAKTSFLGKLFAASAATPNSRMLMVPLLGAFTNSLQRDADKVNSALISGQATVLSEGDSGRFVIDRNGETMAFDQTGKMFTSKRQDEGGTALFHMDNVKLIDRNGKGFVSVGGKIVEEKGIGPVDIRDIGDKKNVALLQLSDGPQLASYNEKTNTFDLLEGDNLNGMSKKYGGAYPEPGVTLYDTQNAMNTRWWFGGESGRPRSLIVTDSKGHVTTIDLDNKDSKDLNKTYLESALKAKDNAFTRGDPIPLDIRESYADALEKATDWAQSNNLIGKDEYVIGIHDKTVLTSGNVVGYGLKVGSLAVDLFTLCKGYPAATMATVGITSALANTAGSDVLYWNATGEHLSSEQLATTFGLSILPYAVAGMTRFATFGNAGLGYTAKEVEALEAYKNLSGLQRVTYNTLTAGGGFAAMEYKMKDMSSLATQNRPLTFGEGLKSLGTGYVLFGAFNGLGTVTQALSGATKTSQAILLASRTLGGAGINVLNGWYRKDINNRRDAIWYAVTGGLTGLGLSFIPAFNSELTSLGRTIAYTTSVSVVGGALNDVAKLARTALGYSDYYSPKYNRSFFKSLGINALENAGLGLIEGVAWQYRDNISKFMDLKGETRIGKFGLWTAKRAAVSGLGGIGFLGIGREYLADITGANRTFKEDGSVDKEKFLTSPGKWVSAGLSGLVLAETIAYGFKKSFQGTSAKPVEGHKAQILENLGRFASPSYTYERMLFGGALEWPTVTAVMDLSKPYINFAFDWLDSKLDIGNGKPAIHWRADEESQEFTSRRGYLRNYVLSNVLQAPLQGLYMGPMIGILSRSTSQASTLRTMWERYPTLSKPFLAIESGFRYIKSLVKGERASFFESGVLPTLSGSSKAMELMDSNVFNLFSGRGAATGKGFMNLLTKGLASEKGLVLNFNKIASLADISFFVTTLDRGLAEIGKIGAYTDYLTRGKLSNNDNYSALSKFDRSNLVWVWLFQKPNSMRSYSRVGTEYKYGDQNLKVTAVDKNYQALSMEGANGEKYVVNQDGSLQRKYKPNDIMKVTVGNKEMDMVVTEAPDGNPTMGMLDGQRYSITHNESGLQFKLHYQKGDMVTVVFKGADGKEIEQKLQITDLNEENLPTFGTIGSQRYSITQHENGFLYRPYYEVGNKMTIKVTGADGGLIEKELEITKLHKNGNPTFGMMDGQTYSITRNQIKRYFAKGEKIGDIEITEVVRGKAKAGKDAYGNLYSITQTSEGVQYKPYYEVGQKLRITITDVNTGESIEKELEITKLHKNGNPTFGMMDGQRYSLTQTEQGLIFKPYYKTKDKVGEGEVVKARKGSSKSANTVFSAAEKNGIGILGAPIEMQKPTTEPVNTPVIEIVNPVTKEKFSTIETAQEELKGLEKQMETIRTNLKNIESDFARMDPDNSLRNLEKGKRPKDIQDLLDLQDNTLFGERTIGEQISGLKNDILKSLGGTSPSGSTLG